MPSFPSFPHRSRQEQAGREPKATRQHTLAPSPIFQEPFPFLPLPVRAWVAFHDGGMACDKVQVPCDRNG